MNDIKKVSIIASIQQVINKIKIRGYSERSVALTMYKNYLDLIDYCNSRLLLGETSYAVTIGVLTRKTDKLRRQCGDICTVKNFTSRVPKRYISDWYLPSTLQLAAMRSNLYSLPNMNFNSDFYWSCNATDGFSQAVVARFDVSYQTYLANRALVYGVRPVREFVTNNTYTVGEVGQYGIVYNITTPLNPEDGDYLVMEVLPYDLPEVKWSDDTGISITGIDETDQNIRDSKLFSETLLASLVEASQSGTAVQSCHSFSLEI